MSFAEFAEGCARGGRPPEGLSPALEALWLDRQGDWAAAHARAQADESENGAWVHAYLHRKEGDPSNAMYWYERAKRSWPADDVSLPMEWEQIARELLGEEPRG